MKKYLIDTNILIEFMHGNETIWRKIREIGIKNCFISGISLCELYFGAYYVKDTKYFAQEIERIKIIRKKFPIITTENNSELFGKIKADLTKAGLPIDEFDILLGSLAITNNLIMVTNNLKHFRRIPMLLVENWLAQ